MGLDVALLEQSFAAVEPKGAELVDRFYRHLFADHPQVKPRFENVDMDRQRKMLLSSLQLIVESLRYPNLLVPTLQRLGARHLAYGTIRRTLSGRRGIAAEGAGGRRRRGLERPTGRGVDGGLRRDRQAPAGRRGRIGELNGSCAERRNRGSHGHALGAMAMRARP